MQERLETAENVDLKSAKISVEKIAKLVSSLRGIMLGMTFDAEAYGRLRIDFEEDATPLASIAKPLVLASLAKHGAMIDEIEDWKVETKGKTIFLSGTLGESGLTRITSLITLPTNALQAPAEGSGQADTTARQPPTCRRPILRNLCSKPRKSTTSPSTI